MKRKKKRDNVDKRIIILLIFFLFFFSYFEITSDIRIGGILSDYIFYGGRLINDVDIINDLESEIKNENEELKKLLQIDYSLSDFNIVNATIIERNTLYFLDSFMINKGKIDGVKDGSIVVVKEGAIGIVVDSSLNTSRIELLSSIGDISVRINNKSKLLSYDNGTFIVRGINNSDGIKVGDFVKTSGLSNLFPQGIIIGKIKDIKEDNSGVGYKGYVELSAKTDNLRFVAILIRKDK